MLKTLKNFVENIPYPIGKQLAKVPFSLRLGNMYTKEKQLIKILKDINAQDDYILQGLNKIFQFAKNNFACYHNLYKQAGVLDLEIKTFEDFKKLPITDKEFFRKNIREFNGSYKLNTGGTTGEPFMFFMDKFCWAREWAAMHTIWETLGYNYHDLKLTLRGKNIGNKNYVYNPVHNEFILNTYKPFKEIKTSLISLFNKYPIKFLHGYPSTIYNLICEMEESLSEAQIKQILSNIKGLFLSSEFPLPYMVDKFKKYNLNFVSWYGHSEMCILAYNEGEFTNTYKPFASYGYAEIEEGNLLGTSYRNFSMPLIRYNTGDKVNVIEKSNSGRCLAFAVKEGRTADFVIDKEGENISLTSLIFGRHHKIFDYAKFVQVKQEEKGKITIYIVANTALPSDLSSLFDMTNINMKVDFKIIEKPILTKAGKFRLKI
ncbi:MAG: hypothetical protein IKP23_03210 [Elusimicrobiaceae bacterium]|nr:hypothetical protein [Elusimicrobiaceae bacterium]